SAGGRSMTVETALPVPVRRRSRAQRIARWIRSDPRAALSIGYLVLLLIFALGAPLIAPYPPNQQNLTELLVAPSWDHWLGTDDLGRDVLSRLIWGAPNSFYASLLAVSVA